MSKSSILSRYSVIKIAIYLICIIFIQVICKNPAWIERYYATGVYPFIGKVERFLLGWLPFSVGDLLYIVVVVGALWRLWKGLLLLIKGKYSWKLFGEKLSKAIAALLFIYCLFYFLWGLNYFRTGIAGQLGLQRENYTTAELKDLTQQLAAKASFYRKETGENGMAISRKALKTAAYQAYQRTANTYPFLAFRNVSTKSSVFGVIGNYVGYIGYYNPFSGEAQINTYTPAVMLPAIYCHEMAHQIGYATEDEANFVGYLTASHSGDPRFLYSTYLDLYDYAAGELYVRDSLQYQAVHAGVDTLVIGDIRRIREYYRPYRTRIRMVMNVFYGQYLKANNQPQGIDTYSDVVSLLIAYRKKYHRL